MVLRALAITTVVASHFQLVYSGGAATSTLFWISGFLFGGLQLHEVQQQRSLKPIGRILKSVLLPLFVVIAPILALKALVHRPDPLSSLLLYVDLIDFTGMPTDGPGAYGGHDYLMWYVHCMIHMLLIIAVLLALFLAVRRVKQPVLWALVATVCLGLASRFILPTFFVPTFWRAPIEGLSIFGHSPTAHLATFALAALTGFLRGRWKWATFGVTLAFVGLSIPTYGLLDSAAIVLVASLLFFAPKVAVPRFLTQSIYMVAGASLFIYLLQFRFLAVFHGLLGLPMIIALVGAVGGGVAVWSAWNWAAQRLADAWATLRGRLSGRVLPAAANPI
jgi:hypothetical protein